MDPFLHPCRIKKYIKKIIKNGKTQQNGTKYDNDSKWNGKQSKVHLNKKRKQWNEWTMNDGRINECTNEWMIDEKMNDS